MYLRKLWWCKNCGTRNSDCLLEMNHPGLHFSVGFLLILYVLQSSNSLQKQCSVTGCNKLDEYSTYQCKYFVSQQLVLCTTKSFVHFVVTVLRLARGQPKSRRFSLLYSLYTRTVDEFYFVAQLVFPTSRYQSATSEVISIIHGLSREVWGHAPKKTLRICCSETSSENNFGTSAFIVSWTIQLIFLTPMALIYINGQG